MTEISYDSISDAIIIEVNLFVLSDLIPKISGESRESKNHIGLFKDINVPFPACQRLTKLLGKIKRGRSGNNGTFVINVIGNKLNRTPNVWNSLR